MLIVGSDGDHDHEIWERKDTRILEVNAYII